MTVPFVIIKDDPLSAEALSIIAGEAQPIRGIKFKRTTTNELMSRTFDPIKWVVPGYISEGFLVLAGRQKLGKTWLAIDMALAVATGGVAMGSEVSGMIRNVEVRDTLIDSDNWAPIRFKSQPTRGGTVEQRGVDPAGMPCPARWR